MAGAAGAYAQGTMTFGDYGNGFTIDVFSQQLLGPASQTHGNSLFDNPVGPTVYTGVGLGGSATGTGPTAYGNGALWTIALYAAPGVNNIYGLAAAEIANTPIVTSLFQTSGGTGAANTGTFGNDSAGVWALNLNSNAKTVFPGFTGGATLQLEACYNGGAANLTYAASPVEGSSVIGEIAALGGTGSPPVPTPNLGASGITSFIVVGGDEIPEPSTIVLGVVGASAFLFRRR